MVSKSDTGDSSSDIENRNVIDHNEREYRGSLNEESVQRVEFSHDVVVGEENASLVLLEDKGSSLVFVEDKRSFKCQRNYICVSGKARCCNNVVLASVWNENVKCWEKYCDERTKERETEIFKLNRDYEILVQNLDVYKRQE